MSLIQGMKKCDIWILLCNIWMAPNGGSENGEYMTDDFIVIRCIPGRDFSPQYRTPPISGVLRAYRCVGVSLVSHNMTQISLVSRWCHTIWPKYRCGLVGVCLREGGREGEGISREYRGNIEGISTNIDQILMNMDDMDDISYRIVDTIWPKYRWGLVGV